MFLVAAVSLAYRRTRERGVRAKSVREARRNSRFAAWWWNTSVVGDTHNAAVSAPWSFSTLLAVWATSYGLTCCMGAKLVEKWRVRPQLEQLLLYSCDTSPGRALLAALR